MLLESPRCAVPSPIAPRFCGAAATFFCERSGRRPIVRHRESVLRRIDLPQALSLRRRRDFASPRARRLWLSDRLYRCLKFFLARDALRQQRDEPQARAMPLRRFVGLLSNWRRISPPLLFLFFPSSSPPARLQALSLNRRLWRRLRRFLPPDPRERWYRGPRMFR